MMFVDEVLIKFTYQGLNSGQST